MLEFICDFSDEQCSALHEAIRTSEGFADQPIREITGLNLLSREEGLTLTVNNFFQIYGDPNFRSLDYFCEYVSKIHFEELEALKELFHLMNKNCYFDLTTHLDREMIELFFYTNDDDRPELLELFYDSTLFELLHQYKTKQINVKVTIEELFKVIGDFTGYKSEIAC